MGNRRKVQVTPKGQVVVTMPKALAQAIGLQRGSDVEWRVAGVGKLELLAMK